MIKSIQHNEYLMQNKGEHWIRSGGANVLKFHINANLIIYQHG
jgi:hypothetical protein